MPQEVWKDISKMKYILGGSGFYKVTVRYFCAFCKKRQYCAMFFYDVYTVERGLFQSKFI